MGKANVGIIKGQGQEARRPRGLRGAPWHGKVARVTEEGAREGRCGRVRGVPRFLGTEDARRLRVLE
eukprot:3876365-Pyramimonas_sp.AAC.1